MAHRGRKNADELLAVALAAGKPFNVAATEAGVSERTARRRWEDREFRQLVSRLRGEMITQTVGEVASGMTEAARTLRELLKSGNDNVKLSAARTLLDMGFKGREVCELEALLEEVQEALAKASG